MNANIIIGIGFFLLAIHLVVSYRLIFKLIKRVKALEANELPPLPSLQETSACKNCGHEKSFHEPLKAKACFYEGCKCKGWSE